MLEWIFRQNPMFGMMMLAKYKQAHSYILKTVKSALVHITDALAKPAVSVKAYIEPVQSGSGDPSPDNVRPITGHTGANMVRTGKNLADGVALVVGAINAQGEKAYSTTRLRTGYVDVEAGTYKIITSPNLSNLVRVYDRSHNYISSEGDGSTWHENGRTITFTEDRTIRIMFSFNMGEQETITEADCDYWSVTPTAETTTIPITFPDAAGTVYSGTYDFVSGKLKSAPYYASYNGETLTGHWISDRDVYAEGTTPTIGAQVVNDGGTLTEYQLTPQQIQMLLGENNVWCDCENSEVELTYKASAS